MWKHPTSLWNYISHHGALLTTGIHSLMRSASYSNLILCYTLPALQSNEQHHELMWGVVFDVVVLTVESWGILYAHIIWKLKNVELTCWMCIRYNLYWMWTSFEPLVCNQKYLARIVYSNNHQEHMISYNTMLQKVSLVILWIKGCQMFPQFQKLIVASIWHPFELQ